MQRRLFFPRLFPGAVRALWRKENQTRTGATMIHEHEIKTLDGAAIVFSINPHKCLVRLTITYPIENGTETMNFELPLGPHLVLLSHDLLAAITLRKC